MDRSWTGGVIALGVLVTLGCAEPQRVGPAAPALPETPSCDFPLFGAAPGSPTPACEPIPYTPQACVNHAWFGAQPLVASQRICLGFVDPPADRSCSESPDNVHCYLRRHPAACNYLEMPALDPCLNELFITCVEHADLGGGRPLWVTRMQSVVKHPPPHPPYTSEVCHWRRERGSWPVAAE